MGFGDVISLSLYCFHYRGRLFLLGCSGDELQPCILFMHEMDGVVCDSRKFSKVYFIVLGKGKERRIFERVLTWQLGWDRCRMDIDQ